VGLRAFLPTFKREPDVQEPGPPPVATAAGLAGWIRAGMRFDVRRMSRDDLREMAYELLAGGAISMPDLRLLALDPVTSAPHWPGWNTFETPGEPDARRDWIEEIAARIRKGHPECAYIGYLQLLLSFLTRVEAARQQMARAVQPAAAAPQPLRPRLTLARPAPARLTSPLPST